MNRDSKIQTAAALVLAASMGLSSVLAVSLTSLAGRSRIVYTDRAEEGQTGWVGVGIAMGAFRGLLVNYLWMRANDMKQDGKFYDAIELSKTITRLQPRFPRVWVFHAWNLAYNISVSTQTKRERWQWVNAGIRLLRDQGIPANPNDMLLHKELAWIYLHKIGGVTDDANPFYKRSVAEEWTIVLGMPPKRSRDDRDRDKAVAKWTNWLKTYTAAADTKEALAAKNPVAIELAAELEKRSGLTFENDEQRKNFLTRIVFTQLLEESSFRAIFEQNTKIGPKTQALRELLKDPKYTSAWSDLLAHVRKRTLIDDYHMDPATMIRFTEKYGPIDWRNPAAHSLYWSAKGVEEALTRVEYRNNKDFDFINTDRVVAQSIQELFRTGDMYFDMFAFSTGRFAQYQLAPDPAFVQTYKIVIDEQRTRSWADQVDARGVTPLSGGYENFLRDAITYFYARGEMKDAEKWYTELRTYGGKNLGKFGVQTDVDLPLDQFVEKELTDSMTRPTIAIQQIQGALYASFNALLSGDDDYFVRLMEYANKCHKYYMQNQLRKTAVDQTSGRMEQLDSDFRFVSGVGFSMFISNLGPEDAEAVYNRAPADLQRFAYENMLEIAKPAYDENSKNGGKKFAEAFPEPSGMDAFRQELARRLQERARPDAGLQMK